MDYDICEYLQRFENPQMEEIVGKPAGKGKGKGKEPEQRGEPAKNAPLAIANRDDGNIEDNEGGSSGLSSAEDEMSNE